MVQAPESFGLNFIQIVFGIIFVAVMLSLAYFFIDRKD